MIGRRQMAKCRECGKEFYQKTTRGEFCGDSCRGAYWRRQYRQQAVEEAEERLQARRNGNGHATPEQRKEASEALAKIVQRGQVSGQFRRRI